MRQLRLLVASVLAAVFGLVIAASPSAADCGWVRVVQIVNGLVHVHFEYRCENTGNGDVEATADVQQPPRDSDWDAVCVRTALAVGANPATFCDLPPTAVTPTLTPGLVARAFRNIPLPASQLSVQPGNGRTLVNFETNFFTDQGEFTRTVHLLGQRVELHIWPSEFRWVFGDGSSLTSRSPGAAYPDLVITHDYRRKGGVRPRVDTTYAARFSVNGGPWRDVSGTVTVPGEPVGVQVVEAGPVLVGYH